MENNDFVACGDGGSRSLQDQYGFPIFSNLASTSSSQFSKIWENPFDSQRKQSSLLAPVNQQK